ncbi:MAG: DUF1653 domain-containing protein [Lachnospiraceae bacterium]|nr:DUF1653 domain-containing protein [Lachnospiraceae bacterium]
MEVKVGDYIEGYEQWGQPEIPEYNIESTLRTHKMRLIVESIWTDNEGFTHYCGQADDSWGGARGGMISTEYGNVRVITDEKPFTVIWWTNKYKKFKLMESGLRREWKAADIVRHFKGTEYVIIGIGVDTNNEQEVIIYKKADNTGNIWVRPRYEFESAVDKDKYPDAEQEWRFELVETH